MNSQSKNPIVKSNLCEVPSSWRDIQLRINTLPESYKQDAFEIALMTCNLASVGVDKFLEKNTIKTIEHHEK